MFLCVCVQIMQSLQRRVLFALQGIKRINLRVNKRSVEALWKFGVLILPRLTNGSGYKCRVHCQFNSHPWRKSTHGTIPQNLSIRQHPVHAGPLRLLIPHLHAHPPTSTRRPHTPTQTKYEVRLHTALRDTGEDEAAR